MANLSKKARVGALISAIWLIVIASFCIGGYRSYSSNENLIVGFLLIGLLPVAVGWFIRWIRKADH